MTELKHKQQTDHEAALAPQPRLQKHSVTIHVLGQKATTVEVPHGSTVKEAMAQAGIKETAGYSMQHVAKTRTVKTSEQITSDVVLMYLPAIVGG